MFHFPPSIFMPLYSSLETLLLLLQSKAIVLICIELHYTLTAFSSDRHLKSIEATQIYL